MSTSCPLATKGNLLSLIDVVCQTAKGVTRSGPNRLIMFHSFPMEKVGLCGVELWVQEPKWNDLILVAKLSWTHQNYVSRWICDQNWSQYFGGVLFHAHLTPVLIHVMNHNQDAVIGSLAPMLRLPPCDSVRQKGKHPVCRALWDDLATSGRVWFASHQSYQSILQIEIFTKTVKLANWEG